MDLDSLRFWSKQAIRYQKDINKEQEREIEKAKRRGRR